MAPLESQPVMDANIITSRGKYEYAPRKCYKSSVALRTKYSLTVAQLSYYRCSGPLSDWPPDRGLSYHALFVLIGLPPFVVWLLAGRDVSSPRISRSVRAQLMWVHGNLSVYPAPVTVTKVMSDRKEEELHQTPRRARSGSNHSPAPVCPYLVEVNETESTWP